MLCLWSSVMSAKEHNAMSTHNLFKYGYYVYWQVHEKILCPLFLFVFGQLGHQFHLQILLNKKQELTGNSSHKFLYSSPIIFVQSSWEAIITNCVAFLLISYLLAQTNKLIMGYKGHHDVIFKIIIWF